MALLVGTSGWHYQHWKGGFYPEEIPASRWLRYYAERFETVELNNAFYRLPAKEAFEKWSAELPEGFVIAVKASRYLTHIRRLREPRDPVRLLLERSSGLGQKLGPFLLQLPPTLKADLESLEATLKAFPADVRVAVELRHPSWFSDECRRILEQRGAALCLADGGSTVTPVWRTTDWTYVRFHRGRASPESCYGDTALRHWAQKLASEWGSDQEIFAYFNNDAHGCAPRDARKLARLGKAVGLKPTRVPGRGETPVN
ncbi:MAG TPA: DUF72 domain-containing protein [Acidimicrobiales bacterium]|nr:DUF72 domain-containing protein [Acidimicrobiales bacterium]